MDLGILKNQTYLGPYPYVPAIWDDEWGLFHLHWTLPTSMAAIASALLAVLFQFTISRLATLSNTVLYISLLHQRSASTLDDQVNAVAVNTSSAISRWYAIFSLAYANGPRKALSSLPFKMLAVSATLLLILQGVSIFFIGALFSHGPVPMTLGPCGFPSTKTLDNSKTASESLMNDLKLRAHRVKVFQDAVNHWLQCSEEKDAVVCPGPIGQNFSWEVFESEPSYCWFGTENCWNDGNARTILQRATITPKDMGTARNSRVALSFISECSYINNTALMTTEIENGNYSVWYFEYGQNEDSTRDPPEVVPNRVMVQQSQYNSFQYFLETFTWPPRYNGRSMAWIPPRFLTKNLNHTSFLNDSSLEYQPWGESVTLIFNNIIGVYSSFRNDDPFFPTTGYDSSTNLYFPEQVASTMVCHDHLEFHVRPKNDRSSDQYTEDDVLNIGNSAYVSIAGVDNEDVAADIVLLNHIAAPPMATISQMQGSALLAANSVDQAGDQRGDPSLVTGRAEQIRWFAIDMLTKLYMAQWITGGENDWGDGVDPIYLPKAEDDTTSPQLHWVCRKTLRITPEYQSLNLIAFIVILALSSFIIGMSYTIEPVLLFIIRTRSSRRKWQPILQAILSMRLHNLLQLHRIAVEKTYGIRFRATIEDVPVSDSTEAPLYGVRYADDEGLTLEGQQTLSAGSVTTDSSGETEENNIQTAEPDTTAGEDVLGTNVLSSETSHKEGGDSEQELYATMLHNGEGIEYYSFKQIR